MSALGIQETDEAVATRVDAVTLGLCEQARRFEDEGDPFLRGPIATRVYRTHPDLPVVLKRAEILARTLENAEPIVLPGQRLIGVSYRRFRVHQGVGDEDAWRIRAMHPERHGCQDGWPLPEAVREEMQWWKGRATSLWNSNPAHDKHGWLWKYGLAHPHGGVGGHTLPDHSIILEAGIDGLRRRLAERLRMVGAAENGVRDELRAMDRCLEGLAAHCQLCAETARRQARDIDDGPARRRLEEAADRCERLATEAPSSFDEALQLLCFSHFADHMDTPGDAASFGRVDQILAPFYEREAASGALTREDALDLVCHFLIRRWAVQSSFNMTVGGLRPDGEDGTNELSRLFLEAMEATELISDMSVRLSNRTPPDFLELVARVLRRGFGRPSLYNDEVTIDALTAQGVDLDDARDYAPLGCVEVMIPGRSSYRTMCFGLNLPKVLELVLNGGRCLVTGARVFEGIPESYESFEALRETYRNRIRRVVEAGVEVIREDERLEPLMYPRPWLTLLSRDGVDDGVDMSAGQPKYNDIGVTLNGVAEIANSLCAVRRLVFEERRLGLDGLREALRADWEGHEPLRQMVLNRLPRFGQDDPETNALAREETDFCASCFEGRRGLYGGRFWPMIFGVTTSMAHFDNPKTGALPSGRRRGDVIAASLQPSVAGLQGSTTAMLRSIASVDFRRFAGGVSNVQELNPTHFEGEEGVARLAQMIRGFFDTGGMELSLNLLDEERLRAAQDDPERYRHVMVRLFGLSARFVDLSPDVQESVIARVSAARRRAPDGAS